MAAATAAVANARDEDDVVAVTGPTPIGPWRAQWWRPFPEGYRVEVEERMQWARHRSGGGEDCYLDPSHLASNPQRLRQVLDRRNMTMPEWFLLAFMEDHLGRSSVTELPRWAAKSAEHFGVTVSEEECRDGLDACLTRGWLRVMDQSAANEVRTLMRNDPALLPLPKFAESRREDGRVVMGRHGKWLSHPRTTTYRLGEIDFTPLGAAFYRTMATEVFGSAWEDALIVSKAFYWEEHHYCESKNALSDVVIEYGYKGHTVWASRLMPIGPWCVHWWERYPAGYRLELELGDS
jgi:hypothetical protein